MDLATVRGIEHGRRVRLAVDAMGGDHGMDTVVPGAIRAAGSHPGIELILVGDQAILEPRLAKAPSAVGTDALLDFRMELTLDGDRLTPGEIRERIAAQWPQAEKAARAAQAGQSVHERLGAAALRLAGADACRSRRLIRVACLESQTRLDPASVGRPHGCRAAGFRG